MKARHRQLAIVVLVLCSVTILTPHSYAWNKDAHRIIAGIAEKHLTPKAREGIAGLLGSETIASVSTYADEIRGSPSGKASWHYVSIPRVARDYDPERDCHEGDCIVYRATEFWRTLADPENSREKRVEALKWLVHLIGDLHQPLHCSGDNKGQNTARLNFFGRKTNVHSVWDGLMLQRSGRSEAQYVKALEAKLELRDIGALQRGTITEWVLEAHNIADDRAYVIPEEEIDQEGNAEAEPQADEGEGQQAGQQSDQTINAFGGSASQSGRVYYEANLPELENQLLRAGVRLARVLNEAFDNVAPPESPLVSRDRSGPVSTSGPQMGWLDRLTGLYKHHKGDPWFWIITGAGGALWTYVLGMLACLLLVWRRGSTVFSRSWLTSIAAKPLVVTPGLGRWSLFLGYRHRLGGQKALSEVSRNYFGLPAKAWDGSMILPHPNGELLHKSIVEAAKPQQPLLIIGKGGAGKSTLLARLAYLALKRELPAVLSGYLPVLVPASYYVDSLIKAIADTLRERDGVSVDESIVKAQLQTGKFLILFDGVSEVVADRAKCLSEILRTACNADYKESRFIIATRPLEVIPSDVQSVTLQPITAETISGLLQHYNLDTAHTNRVRLQLQSFRDKPIEPLLFTMILEQGDDDRMSNTRAEVYERYFRRLLRSDGNDDAWRGWQKALETLAACFLLDTGRRGVGLPHERLIDHLAGNRPTGNKEISLSSRLRQLYRLSINDELELLNYLEEAGLLQKGRRWRFAHDTFEEFFAASYIVSYLDLEEEWPPLARWRDSREREGEFLEIIDFLSEMLDQSMRQQAAARDIPRAWSARLCSESADTSSQHPVTSGDPVPERVLYTSGGDGEPQNSWTLFSSVGGFEERIRIEKPNDETPVFAITAWSTEGVGINKSIRSLYGRADFEYLVEESRALESNVLFCVIPMQETGIGRAGLIEVGTDLEDDPRNEQSSFRVRKFVPQEHFADGKWHQDSLTFDFRHTGSAFYSIFGPRINEGCDHRGAARLVIKNVRLVSFELS